MGLIYLLTCKITHLKYIGQTKKSLYDRLKGHCRPFCARRKSPPEESVDFAIDKYGIESFEYKAVWDCPNDQLNDWEKIWIRLLNTLSPKGYNLNTGGHAHPQSKETKEKIKKSMTGKIFGPMPEERKKKISEAHMGKCVGSNNGNWEKDPTSRAAKRKHGIPPIEHPIGERHWHWDPDPSPRVIARRRRADKKHKLKSEIDFADEAKIEERVIYVRQEN